jgi:hypothetical protein
MCGSSSAPFSCAPIASTTIDLRAAGDSGDTLSRLIDAAGWSIGKSGRGPTNDISPVNTFQS